jgi:hypothetical protein
MWFGPYCDTGSEIDQVSEARAGKGTWAWYWQPAYSINFQSIFQVLKLPLGQET